MPPLLFDALIFEDGSRYKDPNSTPEMGNPSEGLAYRLNDDGKSYSTSAQGWNLFSFRLEL